jgi:hypothetical protein
MCSALAQGVSLGRVHRNAIDTALVARLPAGDARRPVRRARPSARRAPGGAVGSACRARAPRVDDREAMTLTNALTIRRVAAR